MRTRTASAGHPRAAGVLSRNDRKSPRRAADARSHGKPPCNPDRCAGRSGAQPLFQWANRNSTRRPAEFVLIHNPGEGSACATVRGKSIQQKSARAADTMDALADDIEHGLVGDQIAAFHVAERGLERRTALLCRQAFGGAEDVAGGQVAGAQPFASNSAWVPLPTPGAPAAPGEKDAAGAAEELHIWPRRPGSRLFELFVRSYRFHGKSFSSYPHNVL